MSSIAHQAMLAKALHIFQSTPAHRPYELSLSYELTPEAFEVDAQELIDHPFEAPHRYRVGLAVDGRVIFDGYFSDLIHVMDTLTAGLRAKIADESWVDWMGAMEPGWLSAGS